jgi:hypothetical protein
MERTGLAEDGATRGKEVPDDRRFKRVVNERGSRDEEREVEVERWTQLGSWV